MGVENATIIQRRSSRITESNTKRRPLESRSCVELHANFADQGTIDIVVLEREGSGQPFVVVGIVHGLKISCREVMLSFVSISENQIWLPC